MSLVSKAWKILLGLVLAVLGALLIMAWFDTFVVLLKGILGPLLILVGLFLLFVGFSE